MTTITFFRSDGIFYGFEEKGHVGFGEYGNDPFCAMLSSITMYIVDAVEDIGHTRKIDLAVLTAANDGLVGGGKGGVGGVRPFVKIFAAVRGHGVKGLAAGSEQQRAD